MADWSDQELAVAVSAYIWMRDQEGKGKPFSKTKLFERLAAQHGRSEGAWEYRMQNISAVMVDIGRQTVTGLLPAANVGAGVRSRLLRLIQATDGSASIASDSESVLQQLRPNERQRIIDVVANAGIDIRDWAASTSGDANTNPKYCYNWVFGGDDQPTLACLWYELFQLDAGGIFVSYSLRPLIERYRRTKGGSSRAKRADALDTELQKAFFNRKPIRVAIVEGRIDDPDDERSSSARMRVLDEEEWLVTHVDHSDGTFVIRRGGIAGARTALLAAEPISAETAASQDAESEGGRSELVEDLARLQNQQIDSTTKQRLVDARLGQGAFRAALMRVWGGACAATGCRITEMLRASHIKPWRESSDAERLDAENGLLLTANLDALFDKGLIGFEDDGRLWLSSKVSTSEAALLQLPKGLRDAPSPAQRAYLLWHRVRYSGH